MASDSLMATRRAEILAAAEKVFDARGYAQTTMDEVAEAAGISKGSIYNYFQNKHDLFGQVFLESLAFHKADMDKLIAEPMPASRKLQVMMDRWFANLRYYKRIGRLVLEFWATAAREEREGNLPATFQRMYGEGRSQLAKVIAQGMEAGEFAKDYEPAVAASLIMAVVDGITIQSILDVGVNVDEAFVSALKDAIMTALTAPAPSAQRPAVQEGGQ